MFEEGKGLEHHTISSERAAEHFAEQGHSAGKRYGHIGHNSDCNGKCTALD